ncbi:MAG: DNA polymerase I [Candidatus Omnitrophica bacterium]|nr:DNA polymerase I [Candidatus Omnitrophota bacterium]
MPQAFLIDGTAFCYRAFYAIRVLSASDGRPTNAVYGFAMMLGALRKAKQPAYLAVAFDAGKPTFRHERFPDYKIQRKPMPDPLIAQLPLVKELLAAYRIPVFQLEGYEAEDLLATLARRIAAACEVLLVTGDKDALQLVGPRIKVYNPHKDHVVLDAGAVQARYGVPPERMVDLMALMGDAIDNIPGVPGIGEKTASELLRQFGSVEGVYEHLDDLKSASQRVTLAQHREQVELARELARIDDQVPIEARLSDLAVCEPDWTALRKLFRMLDFKRLLAELDAQAPADARRQVRAHVVRDASSFTALSGWFASPDPAAVWSHHDRASGTTVLALAWNSNEAWLLPLEHLGSSNASLEPLWQWLARATRPKLGHDLKAALRWLNVLGKDMQGLTDDTMIAAYLLNPARSSPTLQDTAEEWLEWRLGAVASLETIASHACAILPLAKRLREELRRAQLERLYEDLELPLVHVLADMESAGVAVDRGLLGSLRARMHAQLHTLSEEIYRLAGTEFNLNSPKQLAEVLFGRLKLPVVKRTKTGPSTDSEVLRQLADRHPLPQKLIEYRELTKLVSTYLDALPQLLDPATNRLHSSFNQAGTATGRLSSSEPNLQNIPIKTELGRQIRQAFIPGEPGWVLVAADYSQIELRILAHLSNDPALLDVFRQDRDIHRHTASLIYGVPEEDVTPEMRSAMKAVNFGIIYGMSAHGLSKELGIPHEEAAAFIAAYFARYPRVRACLDEHIHRARQDGYVQTLLGRRRLIPEVNSPDPVVRQFGERMAVNAPIQGTAADLIKLAMVRLAEAFRRRRLASRMILQVHDELVFEVPPGEQETVVALVRDVMERAVELVVPLRVVVKSGPNWLDLEPV